MSRKGSQIWGSLGFFSLWIFVILLGGGVEDVRHDVLCLNVFECLFLYSEMSMYVDIKGENLSK